MNRSFLYGLVGLVGVAGVGLVPLACTAGGVGVPCIPEDEYSFRFPGFKVTEDIIESRSFQCATRICLVNHFQGRVSCPLGQPAPKDAQGAAGCTPVLKADADDTDGDGNRDELILDLDGDGKPKQGSCGGDQRCYEAGSFSPSCIYTEDDDTDDQFCQSLGAGAKCAEAGFCECTTNADCVFVTDAAVSCVNGQCVSYACHGPGDCQQIGATNKDNAGKACCLPGSDTPITTPVCGQCKGPGGEEPPTRDADNAVYCSCRCGVAEGEPDDPNFNFCTCPDGFECAEIRKNVGLGDQKITGKYCIREGTQYDANKEQCGQVDGYWVSGGDSGIKCAGVGTGQCQTNGGPCAD